MKVTKSDWLGLALVGLAVVTVSLEGCGRHRPGGPGGKPAANAGPARAVRVVTVQPRPLQGGLSASGVMVSREEAAVGSELSGYLVSRVYVEQGAWVRRGQPLAQLDDTLLRAQIQQAVAQAAQADTQSKRVTGLDNAGVLSTEQIETRRYQAQVADAALNELKTRQARMTIRAPVGGLVLTRTARPGDISGGANAMFTIARDGLIELNAEVPEAALFSIHVGDQVIVTLPDATTVGGRVRLLDPEVDQATKLGRVRVALPVRADLRPGGFGRATFAGMSAAALTVPETAVRYDADGASVMVLTADNHVQQVDVTTGRRAGGYVELLKGPPAGSRVLLGAASFVLPGDLVKPVGDTIAAPLPGQP